MTTKRFIDHIRRMIIEHDTLRLTFNEKNVTRRTPSQVDDVKYPAITLMYDDGASPAWAPTFETRLLQLTIHTEKFFDCEDIRDILKPLFHMYSYSNQADIDIHRMEFVGGLGTPEYVTKLNKWVSVLQFTVRSG